MTGKDCEQTRDRLRRYVLKTLPTGEQHVIDAHLQECATCREALEAERNTQAVLDALPREEAPDGLAERTLGRIAEGEPALRIEPLWAALGSAVVLLLVLATALLPALARSTEAARRSSTQNTMKIIGLVFKMYANESQGEHLPQLARLDGTWSPDLASLYPKFLDHPGLLLSPQHPEHQVQYESVQEILQQPTPDFLAVERILGENFGYLGYAVTNEDEFETLNGAMEKRILPTVDGILADPGEGKKLYSLRQGIERFYVTDINNPAGSAQAQSEIPVLVEIASWKYKRSADDFDGASVLYMDGHVAFVPYGTFPVVASVLDVLSGIETNSSN